MIPLHKKKAMGGVTGVGHEQLRKDRIYGTFGCLLTVITPLHVGSGHYDLVDGRPVRAQAVRSFGREVRAFIPGTSLKGAVRCAVEILSQSCARILKKGDTLGRLSEPALEPCGEVKAKTRDEAMLCVACRLFGALGYEGRVSFSDAEPAGNRAPRLEVHQLQAPYGPQTRGKLYHPRGDSRFNGRKVYLAGTPAPSANGDPYQVVAKGEQFTFELHLRGVTHQELALLLTAMGALGDGFFFRLGGGKQGMLGSVLIQLYEAKVTGAAASPIFDGSTSDSRAQGSLEPEIERFYSGWDEMPSTLEGATLGRFVGQLKQDRLIPAGLVEPDSLEALSAAWKREGGPLAPEGAY